MQQMVQKDKSCIKLWRLLLWKLHTGVGNSASMEKGEENVTKERVIGKHSRIWESIGSLRLVCDLQLRIFYHFLSFSISMIVLIFYFSLFNRS